MNYPEFLVMRQQAADLASVIIAKQTHPPYAEAELEQAELTRLNRHLNKFWQANWRTYSAVLPK